jgi:hypothetical protein
MAKRIALYDYIEADHIDVSNMCRSIDFTSEHAREDVSGFSASGSDEFLAGRTTQGVTLEIFGMRGANESHQVFYPLHRDKSIFPFVWRANVNSAVSATNPELRGNVQALTYGEGAVRGEVETHTVELTPADSTGLVFYET